MKKVIQFIGIFLMINIYFSCQQGTPQKNAAEEEKEKIGNVMLADERQADERPPAAEPKDEYVVPDNVKMDTIDVEIEKVKQKVIGYKDGGVFVFEGDMIFDLPGEGFGQTGAVIRTGKLWKKNGQGKVVVAYTIDEKYKFPDRINKALKMWSDNTIIEFKLKTNEVNSIHFAPHPDKCQSYVGMIGGTQLIELADWGKVGNIAHEIGHALGLFHEHSRSDRDQFVKVSCGTHNYKKAVSTNRTAQDHGPYNYYSIMHYFTNGNRCLNPLTAGLPTGIPGQRDSLSQGDIKTINYYYSK